jgi:hypothetical protein
VDRDDRPRLAAALSVALILTGCGGGPPRDLAGFTLGMSQDQAMARVRSIGGFTCHVRGTIPRLTSCEGATSEGVVKVVIRDDVTVGVSLRTEPAGRNPRRKMRRFVKGFGDPAWRERPYPTRFDPLEGYHTFWLDRDSTRSIAMVCAGQKLEPPCTAELALTSPAAVHSTLDALLGIER